MADRLTSSLAFFEKAFEATTGLIDRCWFENILATQFESDSNRDQDPSWYALRFTVYAFGCRIHLGSQSYTRAVEASVALFENALSVQPDIMQCRSSITSVRALMLMARNPSTHLHHETVH